MYAPVASHDSIRYLIAISAAENSTLEGADISNAYLYGNLDVPIIMEQPTESSQLPAMPGYVCKLVKSIYGARQAGEIWGSLLNEKFLSWGFKTSTFDNRLYFLRNADEFITLTVVVDDLAFASNSTRMMSWLKSNLKATFDVKLFGSLTSFIGWNISITSDYIKVDQQGYVRSLLQTHGYDRCNAVHAPLSKNADIIALRDDEMKLNSSEHTAYRSIVGGLLYLAFCTRPDLSCAVTTLARQVHAPGTRHMMHAKRVLRYVAGTACLGLKYSRSQLLSPKSFRAHVDADWGGDKDSRASATGYVIDINGTPVSWRTKRQTVVALSSAESEHIALSECAKQVKWMRKMYWEFIFKTPWLREVAFEPTHVHMDSSAAESIAKSNQISAKSKHIDIRFHHVKSCVRDKVLKLSHVSSANNTADLLTKVLDLSPFTKLVKLIGLSSN